MGELLNLLILFILSVLAVVIAGLVAGFSPTLYIAQATLSSKSQNRRKLTLSLVFGVLSATIILLVLFQIFSLSSLLAIIDSTVRALLVSVLFNIAIGLLFITAGIHYMRTRDTQKAYSDSSTGFTKKYGGSGALFGLGFIKTFLSVSGLTAIYIGGNIIATTTSITLERIILTGAFLVSSVAPFMFVSYLTQRKPDKLRNVIAKVKQYLEQINYRSTVGFIAVLIGSAIVIFNIIMALFY